MNQIKIGELIHSLRTKNKLTQKQLAEQINVSDKAVSKWETGFPKLKDTTLKTHAYITSK